jgi:hypothetical protein
MKRIIVIIVAAYAGLACCACQLTCRVLPDPEIYPQPTPLPVDRETPMTNGACGGARGTIRFPATHV